jgi:signal transduction histidine kinase
MSDRPERVLVVAPTPGDAALTRSVLREAGLACHVCSDINEASVAIAEGVGVLVLTDEVVAGADMSPLLRALRSQPAWSEIPIVMLWGAGADSFAASQTMHVLGNVAVLEKPVRIATLVSSLHTAIRARRRQYQIRDQLHDLVRAESRLRDTDRQKDEFLATLAHELRNPLAPIRNALQIMQLTGNDRGAVEQARGMMERQVGQMVRLIDDLLDVSRITRGKLELRKERIELAAAVGDAVETARPLIDAAGHMLEVRLPEQPVFLDADPVRFAQILSNLLNNAAKYTERGGRIWLTAERSDSQVRLSVRDTGIGIPAKALPSIFDMFTQVDSSFERTHEGLGIGLTLVKRLTEMHGGSIEASSAGAGKGAEFIVRLPVVVAAAIGAPHLGEHRHPQPPAKCRILVADDNGDSAESMGAMLRLMGNEVRIVRDGLQAVDEAVSAGRHSARRRHAAIERL